MVLGNNRAGDAAAYQNGIAQGDECDTVRVRDGVYRHEASHFEVIYTATSGTALFEHAGVADDATIRV